MAWATAFAAIYYHFCALSGGCGRGFGVVSHWVLDWITHGPDMQLYPGGARFGLALWNSIPGTLGVELTRFAVGIWMYVRTTRARDSIGRWAFVAYVVLLLAFYIGDRFGGAAGRHVGYCVAAIIATIIMFLWAWWFDRHRVLREYVRG